MQDDDHTSDPQENPENTGHLPVAGEVGVGPVSHDDDPVTQDTDDNPDNQPDMNTPEDQSQPLDRRTDNIDKLGHKRAHPGPAPDQIGNDPTVD